MKKVLLGTLAVLTLAACSKDEVVQQNPNDAISFTATTNKAISRAADGYCNKLTPKDFVVSASYTDGATTSQYFLNNKFVKVGTADDGKQFVADGSYRYWPDLTDASKSMKFYAAVHATPAWKGASDFTGMKVDGYTVEAAVADQKDFLYAVQPAASVPTDGKLNINFRHALSQIEFAATNDNSKIRVEICGVSVVNVNSKGNFTFPESTDGNVQDHDFGGTYPDADKVGTWAGQSDKTTYAVTFDPQLAETGTSLTVTDPTEKEYNTNTMYLLPQQLESWNRTTTPIATSPSNTDTYFLVKAKIWNIADAGGVYNASDVLLWGTDKTSMSATGAKDIAIPAPATKWEPGKRYVYTFKFTKTGEGGADPSTGKDVLIPITLEIKVDDFVNGGVDDPVNMSK